MLRLKQSSLFFVLLGFLLNGCDCIRRFRAPNTHRAVVKLPPAYTIGIIVMMVVIGLCLFTCRFLFPNGMEFTALDLDEIRLERLSSIESRIRRNIRDLKSKLSFHKDKRKKVERERNMKIQLQGFLNNTNNNHKNNEDRIYDQENFPSPDKIKRKRTAADPQEERVPLIIRDKNNETGGGKEEAEEEQEEEKEDLWQLWNKMATHQKGNNNNNNTENKNNSTTTTEGVGGGGGGAGNPLYKSIKYENKAGKKSAPFLSMAVPSEMAESKQAEQERREDRGVLPGGGGGLSREFNRLSPVGPGPASKKTSATPIEVSSSYSSFLFFFYHFQLFFFFISFILTFQKNYSISVSVKDYRAAEKYSGK
jgi:hypothetical protein